MFEEMKMEFYNYSITETLKQNFYYSLKKYK